MPASFVHLRVHSAYSLAESTLRIKKIAALAAGDSQPAVAITDTNNMFGALEFCKVMMDEGVQPIVGVQALLSDARGSGEVVLLAQTETGYSNLCKLNSKGYHSICTDIPLRPSPRHLWPCVSGSVSTLLRSLTASAAA